MKQTIKLTGITILMTLMLSLLSFKISTHHSPNKVHNKYGNCYKCNGSGKCTWCDGSGTKRCMDCKGSGEEGTVKNADGTTTVLKCYRCSGRGSYDCTYCSTSGKCAMCDGTGKSPYEHH